MNQTFTAVRGYSQLPTDHLTEGFSHSKPQDIDLLVINVSAERLNHLFYLLCRQVPGSCYFVLEIEQEEEGAPTRDVYFWKGISQAKFWQIYGEYSELLMNSGGVRFGFASHYAEDEVYVGPYKAVRVFTQEPEKYLRILTSMGIPRVEHLTTVSDVLGESALGQERYLSGENREALRSMVARLEAEDLKLGKRFWLQR